MAARSPCRRDASRGREYYRAKIVETTEYPHRGSVGVPVIIGAFCRQMIEFALEHNLVSTYSSLSAGFSPRHAFHMLLHVAGRYRLGRNAAVAHISSGLVFDNKRAERSSPRHL
jgi:hypothetical protein